MQKHLDKFCQVNIKGTKVYYVIKQGSDNGKYNHTFVEKKAPNNQ